MKTPEELKKRNRGYQEKYYSTHPGSRERINSRYYQKTKVKKRGINHKYYRGTKTKKKETNRIANLVRIGITPSLYDSIERLQGGVCAICGSVSKSGRKLAVDHNHATGKVRGLLCLKCNVALGLMSDNPDLLISAVSYLRERN
jgi:hypothetical protein